MRSKLLNLACDWAIKLHRWVLAWDVEKKTCDKPRQNITEKFFNVNKNRWLQSRGTQSDLFWKWSKIMINYVLIQNIWYIAKNKLFQFSNICFAFAACWPNFFHKMPILLTVWLCWYELKVSYVLLMSWIWHLKLFIVIIPTHALKIFI